MDATIVGGVFGLLGVALGLAGPWFIETRREKSERKKRRAEKLEELVAALYEHNHWLILLRNVRVFGHGEEPSTVPPFAKIEAIAAVHFPQFAAKLAKLDIAADEYEIWMLKAAEKRVASGSPDATGMNDAHTPYFQLLRDVLKDIRAYAKSEFQ